MPQTPLLASKIEIEWLE